MIGMSDYTPHPDDVTLAVKATNIEFGIHEPTQQQEHYIEVVLAAVGPAHDKRVRAEVLRQAAEWWITELRKIHVRRDDDPYILGPTCRRCNQSWPCATEAFIRRRADAEEIDGHVSDNELPGMWSNADLSGGWADAEGTTMSDAAQRTAVYDALCWTIPCDHCGAKRNRPCITKGRSVAGENHLPRRQEAYRLKENAIRARADEVSS